MDLSRELLLAWRKWMKIYMFHSIHYFVRFAKENDLSFSQLAALFQIHGKACSSASRLSEALGITPAASSQMLDRLVSQGLIARSEDEHDRRVKQNTITALGETTLNEALFTQKNWLNSLANSLSDSEKHQVISAIELLSQKALELEDQTASEPSQ